MGAGYVVIGHRRAKCTWDRLMLLNENLYSVNVPTPASMHGRNYSGHTTGRMRTGQLLSSAHSLF